MRRKFNGNTRASPPTRQEMNSVVVEHSPQQFGFRAVKLNLPLDLGTVKHRLTQSNPYFQATETGFLNFFSAQLKDVKATVC